MKFQSFLKYFDWLETQVAAQQAAAAAAAITKVTPATDLNQIHAPTVTPTDGVQVSRKVFSGKQWLTIEDWLECTIPLCPMEIRHESRIERSPDDIVQTVFASSRIGGDFLSAGWSQVNSHPEKSTFPITEHLLTH